MTSKLKTDVLETVSGSGTIALTNQLSGMTTASLPALGSAQMPTGSVLQVVNTNTSTGVANAGSGWADTGIVATITPSSTSSKILILVDGQGFEINQAPMGFSTRLLRGSTSLSDFNLYSSYTYANNTTNVGINYLDSPSTTSATTYKVQIVRSGAAGTANAQANGSMSTITLMEIQG